MTGELLGRELPLTQEERLSAFESIRMQALTVDLARRRKDTAKEEAKEAGAAYERELQRLFDLTRHDPQGMLFPVTEEEIKQANQQIHAPPPPKTPAKPEEKKDEPPADGEDSAEGDRAA